MNKRCIVLSVILLLLSSITFAQNKSKMDYQAQWKTVNRFTQNRQPKSALTTVEQIYAASRQEGNFAQTLKAAFTRVALREELSPDSLTQDAVGLEQLGADCRNVADRAVWHVLMASFYSEQQAGRWGQRDETHETELRNKVHQHRDSVLLNMEELAGWSLTEYAILYETGRDSKLLYHDDVLSAVWRDGVKRTSSDIYSEELDTEDELRVLGQMERIYTDKGMRNAAVLCELETLNLRRELNGGAQRLSRKGYEQALQALYLKNTDTEAGADVFGQYMETVRLPYSQQDSLLAWALERWPKSALAQNFKNQRATCAQRTLNVCHGNGNMVAGEPLQVVFRHRNLRGGVLQVLQNKRVVESRTLQFHETGMDWAEDSVTLTLPAGYYRLRAVAENKEDTTSIHLSRWRVLCVGLHKYSNEVIVVDAMTGKPVSGATVTASWQERVGRKWQTSSSTLRTDAEGRAHLPQKAQTVVVEKDGDKSESCSVGHLYRSSHDSGKETGREVYEVFTDRAIYRPGQTLHVSGLVYRQQGDVTEVMANLEVKMSLRDANHQVVKEQTLHTDAWGMAMCDFVIPEGKLVGTYSVRFGNETKYVRVEEYKRPTFSVEFEPVEGAFALGDSVTLRGKVATYSGVPVSQARVTFQTLRSQTWFRCWWMCPSEEKMDAGEVLTDENGCFEIPVLLTDDREVNEDEESDEDEWNDPRRVFTFRVSAQVTDQAGESHDGETTVRVGRSAFGVTLEAADQIDQKDGKPIPVRVKTLNANGQSVEAVGKWVLRKWNPQTKTYDGEVATGTWTSGDSLALSAKGLAMGSYQLTFTAQDAMGKDIQAEHTFTVWNSDDTTSYLSLEKDFLYVSSNEMDAKQGVDVWYAPSCEHAYIYLYIHTNDSVMRCDLQEWQPNLHHLHLDYQPWMGDGVEIVTVYVQDNEVEKHFHRAAIALRKLEKELKMEWQTFRDHLVPGQQETWTLRVSHSDGTPAKAEVLATMFDASLDALTNAPHRWQMSVNMWRRTPYLSFQQSYTPDYFALNIDFARKYKESYLRTWNGLYYYDYYRSLCENSGQVYGMGQMRHGRAVFSTLAVEESAMPIAMAAAADAKSMRMTSRGGIAADANDVIDETADVTNKESNEGLSAKPQVRANFAETAFFYPDLLTDGQGNVQIQFTLPESLTEWKVLTLAHTKDVDYGTLEGMTVARKDFMVQPQMPRFVREGDKVSIASRLINTTDHALNGQVKFRLTDAANGKEVSVQTKNFSLHANETQTVTFDYSVPEDAAGLLVCEVTGQSDKRSDGERNYLPVLTNRKMLYETIPFYIDQKGEKQVDLSTLFNQHSETATHRMLTIDYTDNPSWTAVMALHALVNPQADNSNAMAWSAALYANCVAQSIAQRLPRLQSLLESWKQETGKDKTLDSELQKNQELKEVLLQETPWLLDAQKETEERNRLTELFDENLLNQRIRQAQEKLDELQYADGGWGWMQGMKANYYTTLAVSEHLAKLVNYIGQHPLPADAAVTAEKLQTMLNSGIGFLDKEEWERYKKYYRDAKQMMPAESTCRYLYLKTLAQQTDKTGNVEQLTEDYLRRVANNVGALTMYGQANMAVVLLHHDRKKAALDFVRSLREYLVEKPGMGRYFDTRHALYSWMDYRIPTHIATMRALQATASDFGDTQETLRDMQLWLLRQKQAQKWDNEMNTLEVCDLLLSISPDRTFHEAQAPVLMLDGKKVETPTPTAGIGYVKVAVPEKRVDAKMLTVRKSSNDLSWGCAYGQSLERLDRVESTETGKELHIERTLYRRTMNGEGKTEWQLLTDGTLHVGDRIRMRLRVQADRDMDFLQIRCQHAACMESVNQLSGYKDLGGRGGYLAHHDAESDLFFDWFMKGSATVDLEFYVTRTGHYQQGIATLQSAYAPAFTAHSDGAVVEVTEQ